MIKYKYIWSVICILVLFSCTSEDEPAFENPYYPVIGPTVMLNPIEMEVDNNDEFSIEIRCEGVSDVMGLYAEIQFDTLMLEYHDFELLAGNDDLLTDNSGEIVSFIDTPENGTVQVNLVTVLGEPLGLTGSGDIISLKYKSLQSGDTYITVAVCRLTAPDLNEIQIFEIRGGAIHVK